MRACEICGQPGTISIKGWESSVAWGPVALLAAWVAKLRAPMHYGCVDHIQDVADRAKGEVSSDGRTV